ncbi:hypothetical protein ACYULU_05425 [Breznakiellaceae bacterium SP9]
MTVSRKAALTLLITVVIFAVFAVLSYSGLFNYIETRFYNSSIIYRQTTKVKENAKVIGEYLERITGQFKAVLNAESVKMSYEANQSAQHINEREDMFLRMQQNIPQLKSVRFVDSNGRRIHYSTLKSDIRKREQQSIEYWNYDRNNDDIPFEMLSVGRTDMPKLTLDNREEQNHERLIFSFPITVLNKTDMTETYRGTALFTLSVAALQDELVKYGNLMADENLVFIDERSPQPVIGILLKLPYTNTDDLRAKAVGAWRDNVVSHLRVNSPDSDRVLTLISAKTAQGYFVGRYIDEADFTFPTSMKTILLACFFSTLYLAIFLLFNLRQDNLTIIQHRLKNLQISLIEEYYERKGDIDFKRWTRELDQRRDEIFLELKRGMKDTKGTGLEEADEIDTIIDKAWADLLRIIGGYDTPRKLSAEIDEEKLHTIFKDVLAEGNFLTKTEPDGGNTGAPVQTAVNPKQTPQTKQNTAKAAEEGVLEELEALEELPPDGEAEVLEELEELSDGEAEELEELEELPPDGDAEALEELEELPSDEEAEALEELEELPPDGEAEALEELEELEELPPDAAATVLEELPPRETANGLAGDEKQTALPAQAAKRLIEAPAAGLEYLDLDGLPSGEDANTNTQDDPAQNIVESSGLELVDDNIIMEDIHTNNKKPPEESTQGLESDDSVEELEELEELEPLEPAHPPVTDEGSPREASLAGVASSIEFDENCKPPDDDAPVVGDIEIVSPLSSILCELNAAGDEELKKKR